jgi:cysteinyl-tRNA synthetase
LATAWEVARGTDAPAARVALLREFDAVLGLDLLQEQPTEAIPPEVAALIDRREALRQQRDWAGADALRAELRQHGYAVEDTPQGPRWKKL